MIRQEQNTVFGLTVELGNSFVLRYLLFDQLQKIFEVRQLVAIQHQLSPFVVQSNNILSFETCGVQLRNIIPLELCFSDVSDTIMISN